jgi:hypothetical protein
MSRLPEASGRVGQQPSLWNGMLLSCPFTRPRGRHVRTTQEKDEAERSATAKTIFLWPLDDKDLITYFAPLPAPYTPCLREQFDVRNHLFQHASTFVIFR